MALTSRKATSKKVDDSSESAPRRFGNCSSGIVIPSNKPDIKLVLLLLLLGSHI